MELKNIPIKNSTPAKTPLLPTIWKAVKTNNITHAEARDLDNFINSGKGVLCVVGAIGSSCGIGVASALVAPAPVGSLTMLGLLGTTFYTMYRMGEASRMGYQRAV